MECSHFTISREVLKITFNKTEGLSYRRNPTGLLKFFALFHVHRFHSCLGTNNSEDSWQHVCCYLPMHNSSAKLMAMQMSPEVPNEFLTLRIKQGHCGSVFHFLLATSPNVIFPNEEGIQFKNIQVKICFAAEEKGEKPFEKTQSKIEKNLPKAFRSGVSNIKPTRQDSWAIWGP